MANKNTERNRKFKETHPDYYKHYYELHKETLAAGSRKRALKFNFRITLDDYNQLFEKQNGRCAICGKHQSELTRNLAVDHDHKTGKIRGLLCLNCNCRLERFKSDFFVAKAAEYLQLQHTNKIVRTA